MGNEKIGLIRENIEKVFVGKGEVIDNIMVALLAGGHILIEDVPGVGKTTLAKAVASSIKATFARVQFTPDTLPSDIVGMSIFDPAVKEFKTVKGPVHNEIVLADEINRTSPKTQAALLEAMEEHQVTIDGTTFALPELFMVIATENPSSQVGTYVLPEAELDRFMMKVSIGYPDKEMQMDMAKKFLTGELSQGLTSVINAKDVVAMKEEVKSVIMSDELIEYALNIVDATRGSDKLEYGLSPRAGLDLLIASKACAYVDGRDYVIPEDVIKMAKVTLCHRLILTTSSRMNGNTGYQIILEIIERVKRPR